MVNTAFYCVADSRYFLGVVGMINSLRLVGHNEPIYVLDCGLRAQQRALIEVEATIVECPSDLAPQVMKTIAPLAHPAETMVLIDTDMIVTRRLTGLIATAAAGHVVGGSAELDRFCPEWEQLLGLGQVHRRPYISTGLVLCGGAVGQELIRLVDERKHLVDFELSFWRRNVADYPLVHADQDLINGVLAARAGEREIVVFEPRLSASPPFEGLEIVDLEAVRCAYDDGQEPYVVHHWLTKPWLEPTEDGVYSRLLRRLLNGRNVAIDVPDVEIPRRFRPGLRAFAERTRIDAVARMRRLREPAEH